MARRDSVVWVIAVVALVVWCGVWVVGCVRPMVVPVGVGAGGSRFLVIGDGEVVGVVQRASGVAGTGLAVETTTLGSLVVRQGSADGLTTSVAAMVVSPRPMGPTKGWLGAGRVLWRSRIGMQIGPPNGAVMINMSIQGWAVPCWLVALAPAGVGVWFGRRAWEIRRRRVEGRCAACGYDLRASLGRCPECGVEIGGRV